MKSGTFPPPSLKADADPELTYKSLDANSNNILDSVSLIILSLSSIKVCWRWRLVKRRPAFTDVGRPGPA